MEAEAAARSAPTGTGPPAGPDTPSALRADGPAPGAPGAAAPATVAPPARPPKLGLRRLAEAALVGAVAVALAAWGLGLGGVDLGLPLRYAPVDDAKFYLMLVKGIIEHGSYLTNPSLGAPFGQHLADYPQGADNLSLLLIAVLGRFSSNPALVENLFLLATFALTGAVCHLVLRAQEVSAPAAGVVSVLFALLPYHFFRGESHLLLSAYYAVPLGAYLFLEILGGDPLFSRRDRPGRSRIAGAPSGRSVITLALCVAIGSDNLYYATFSAVMMAGAAAIALVIRRRRAALEGLVALVLIAATVAANLAPTFVYAVEHGANPRLQRSVAADEGSNQALSLRLTNLILPPPNDRIHALARLADRYDRSIAPGYCEGCYASLGVVGSVGLGWLGICALGTLAGAGVWYGGRRRFRHAALGAGLALAVGTVGGISSLLELLVTPDIRGWSRISLLIACFSLYAVALLLDSLVAHLRRRSRGLRRSRALAALVLGAVLAFGVYEQTSPSDAPNRSADERAYRSDATFVAHIQRLLPRGASVFQLPYVPFPEGYPSTPCCGPIPTYATKYEPLRGYLHSTTLRWSYGAVKGRGADWPAQLAGRPLGYLLPAVAAAGFEGLWLDPAAFTPAIARRLIAGLRSLLGEAPVLSPDRDLDFFDLRGYAARLRRTQPPRLVALLRIRTLYPVRAVCAPGGVKAINPASMAQAVQLQVHRADTHFTYERRLVLAPGTSSVRIPGSGRVLYTTVTDARLLGFDQAGPRSGAGLVPGLTGPGCPG